MVLCTWNWLLEGFSAQFLSLSIQCQCLLGRSRWTVTHQLILRFCLHSRSLRSAGLIVSSNSQTQAFFPNKVSVTATNNILEQSYNTGIGINIIKKQTISLIQLIHYPIYPILNFMINPTLQVIKLKNNSFPLLFEMHFLLRNTEYFNIFRSELTFSFSTCF